MCMLTYLPGGVLPDPEALANGAEFNRDGHGFAIVNGRKLIVHHGMKAHEVIAEFVKVRAKHPDGPAMFHSRYGTGGSVSEYNCHPFRIGGDRKTVLGHNGVLPEMVQPGKGEKRCDTRITAEDLLRDWDLGDAGVRAQIGAWMGTRNKFVILTVNPRYEAQAWIINEASGLWHGDTWYSNRDFQGFDWAKYLEDRKRMTVTTTLGGKAPDYEDDPCWQCQSMVGVDLDRGVCLDCNCCQDCGEDFDEACQCLLLPGKGEVEPVPEYGYGDEDAGASAAADSVPDWNRLAKSAGLWSLD